MQNHNAPNSHDNTSRLTTKAQQSTPTKSVRSRAGSTIQINLTIATGLLQQVDIAAEKDYTTRSDLIRTALLWYLRPQGRDLDQTDPEVILKTLQHRHSQVQMRKMIKDVNIFND